MNIVTPDETGLSVAAEAIRRGAIVAYPTETVYGLGVDPFSDAALEALWHAKGRESDSAFLLIIGEMGQLDRVVREIPSSARALMENLWPGPLSLVLPAKEGLPQSICGEGHSVCVRLTDSQIAGDLCRAVGGPITSTSANATGEDPALCLADIALEGIAVGIDGGTLEPSAPSTVFDPERGLALREGAISLDAIETVLKRQVTL